MFSIFAVVVDGTFVVYRHMLDVRNHGQILMESSFCHCYYFYQVEKAWGSNRKWLLLDVRSLVRTFVGTAKQVLRCCLLLCVVDVINQRQVK